MSVGRMEAPYSIASLTKPIDSVNGRTHAAPVYGVRGSKKRKRHEVVVGVDGEGLSIYNVQSQRLITSYALPPQSYLCGPPVSAYMRANESSAAKRHTYCVVKDGPTEQKRRLVCFTETLRRDSNKAAAPERKELKLKDGEITGLNLAPVAQDRLVVVAVYISGVSLAIDADLSKSIELNRPSIDSSDDYQVESSAIIDTESARKGLIKSRQDVSAHLDQLGGIPTLQWRILRTHDARHFQLLAIKLSQLDGVSSLNRGVTPLMTYELFSSSTPLTASAVHEMHASTGMLYELVASKLSIYDLSGAGPKFVTRLGSVTAPISSFTRLSAASILTSGGDRTMIYESKFGSVQGSMALSSTDPESSSRKRKHEEIETHSEPLHFITSLNELRLAVGINGHELMVLPLSDSVTENKRSRTHGTQLIDVIGKGSVKDNNHPEKVAKKSREWEEWTAKVTGLVSDGDIEGLEHLVANDGQLGKQRRAHKLSDFDEESGVVFDDATTYDDLWPLPETLEPQGMDRRKVLYILEQVFVPGGSGDRTIEIGIRSSKLIEWLSLTGLLNSDSLRKVAGGMDYQIRSGDIMAAVRTIDEDFQLIHDLLHLPVHWELSEVVQALRQILQSFNTNPPPELQLALPAPIMPNGDANLPNVDTDSALEVAESELDYAVSALTTGLEVRSDALRTIFARLHSLHPTDVKATMRAMMTQGEIFFLIHILRIELADGAWTSRYIDLGQDTSEAVEGGMVDTLAGMEESGPSDESIKVIGFLLNCAVDAIGIGGWLVGLGGNLNAKELVESLRAEVSAGYEGCLEANTVQSFLAEVEKFERMAVEKNMGGYPDGAVLPMGGRPAPAVVKGREGGSGRKSKIAKAMEKSRAVGKYSFERIRI